jgi:(4-(4-[2-(gamma-L-glutamylamino)ethyl]phenoxymethyl)furan-2-yl)methanamine synthase
VTRSAKAPAGSRSTKASADTRTRNAKASADTRTRSAKTSAERSDAGVILGWDIGGANIKLARIHADGRWPPTVLEHAFPLWREFDRLPSVLAELADRVGCAPVMAVTMTAELADCFATKRDGVGFVIGAFETAFPGSTIRVYGVDGRFRSADEARDQPYEVAAANWMASAALVARGNPDALFLDVGSTTADIIPIVGGRVAAEGCTDTVRLRSGELVYTGCLRTPVCAIVRSVPVHGGKCGVAAEHFAIAADVHRWLGQIDDAAYTCETPDGRGRSRAEAGARLARMVCADLETLGENDLSAIARHVANAQTQQIADGIRQVMQRLGGATPRVAVVAGSGAFLARAAADAAGLATRDLADEVGAAGALAVPALAVAHLLSDLLSTERR